ncbi:DUF262 domain-containing protein [Deinococcus taklimakanensis]|uniref:DUF262 domain-containing protein n=1 Tax=Deinococcus taklimakanensis TaxID=536443 RepID=A0ABW5P549_9DEIO
MTHLENAEMKYDEIEQDSIPEGEENISEPWNPNDSKIDTKLITIDIIRKRLENNEIDLSPNFQRHGGIWSEQQKSWLIESILIRIPIPTFYFDATNEDKWVVIDGLQRLTTLRQFLLDGFKLRRMQYLSAYDGYAFADLPRHLQRRIEETQITVNLIQPGTPDKVKFDIFRRINTGGVTLSPQEIRNALNQGSITKFLTDLACSQEFKEAVDGSVTDTRMVDQDFVLRFLAFSIMPHENYNTPDVDAFLNEAMSKLNKIPQEYPALEKSFMKSMRAARDIFGNRAFRKIYKGSQSRNPINKALFEVWSIVLSRLSEDEICKLVSNREKVIAAFSEILSSNKDFDKSISYGTQDVGKTKLRFSVIQKLVRGLLDDQ